MIADPILMSERDIYMRAFSRLAELNERQTSAVRQALQHLQEDPPRKRLAVQCLKAALDPTAERWSDAA